MRRVKSDEQGIDHLHRRVVDLEVGEVTDASGRRVLEGAAAAAG